MIALKIIALEDIALKNSGAPMKIQRLAIALFIIGAPLTYAAEVVVRAVELTAFGTFNDYGKQFERGYNNSGPGTESLEYVRFTKITNQIPGELGTSFGIQYIIHSSPKGQPFKVTGVITYPGEGLISPEGHFYKQSEESIEIKIGEKSFYGFGFDYEWEIIPGDWKFQIKRGTAILAEKILTVLPPATTQQISPAAETGK